MTLQPQDLHSSLQEAPAFIKILILRKVLYSVFLYPWEVLICYDQDNKAEKEKRIKIVTDMYVYIFSNLLKMLEMLCNGKHTCNKTKCQ